MKLSDRDRLELLVSKYREDFANSQVDEPLRLLMGYAYAVDKAGHRSGPTSPAVDAAIGEMDRLLADIVGQVAGIFHEHMHPEAGNALWVLFTTDHGMSDVRQMVSIRHLMGGDEVPESVIAETSGGLANVCFHLSPRRNEPPRWRAFWSDSARCRSPRCGSERSCRPNGVTTHPAGPAIWF